jgi:hypothetical protein
LEKNGHRASGEISEDTEIATQKWILGDLEENEENE